MEGKRSQEKLKKEKGKEVETRGMGRRVHSLKEGGESSAWSRLHFQGKEMAGAPGAACLPLPFQVEWGCCWSWALAWRAVPGPPGEGEAIVFWEGREATVSYSLVSTENVSLKVHFGTVVWHELMSLPNLNLNDAISHHQPPVKSFLCILPNLTLAKTILWNSPGTWAFLLNNILNSPRSHETNNIFS